MTFETQLHRPGYRIKQQDSIRCVRKWLNKHWINVTGPCTWFNEHNDTKTCDPDAAVISDMLKMRSDEDFWVFSSALLTLKTQKSQKRGEIQMKNNIMLSTTSSCARFESCEWKILLPEKVNSTPEQLEHCFRAAHTHKLDWNRNDRLWVTVLLVFWLSLFWLISYLCRIALSCWLCFSR